MRVVGSILGSALLVLPFATDAWAQRGLATSGTLGGQNTIQQAPSGGRVNGGSTTAGGTAAGGAAAAGQPTAAERETEKRNKAVTQICKGC